ncbi:MAG: hypothetical protein P1P83_09500 [Bacteroidales bacterium]|jgi:uncharacterized membrane protein|nr:hypothetical protein [Bacteroidales bacterium]MDT8374782.1 hypothetical protein [Bacteroidales bacterium]
MLDIRLPIGLMFSVVGLIITIYGLATIGDVELYERSLNVNVNLISGLGTLAFGLIMLLLSEPVRKKLRKKE